MLALNGAVMITAAPLLAGEISDTLGRTVLPIPEPKSKFAGHIPNVTIETKPMQMPDKAAAEKAGKEADRKKAMSD